jgi:hypothetical protein
MQVIFKGLFMIVNERETVVVIGRHKLREDGFYVFGGCSVDHPDCPEKKNPVRATLHTGGWIMHAIHGEPEKTRVMYFNSVSHS